MRCVGKRTSCLVNPVKLEYLSLPDPDVDASPPLVAASGEEAIVERVEKGEEVEGESLRAILSASQGSGVQVG